MLRVCIPVDSQRSQLSELVRNLDMSLDEIRLPSLVGRDCRKLFECKAKRKRVTWRAYRVFVSDVYVLYGDLKIIQNLYFKLALCSSHNQLPFFKFTLVVKLAAKL